MLLKYSCNVEAFFYSVVIKTKNLNSYHSTKTTACTCHHSEFHFIYMVNIYWCNNNLSFILQKKIFVVYVMDPSLSQRILSVCLTVLSPKLPVGLWGCSIQDHNLCLMYPKYWDKIWLWISYKTFNLLTLCIWNVGK